MAKNTPKYRQLLGLTPPPQVRQDVYDEVLGEWKQLHAPRKLIVAYLRVSDPKQGDKYGLQSQLADIQTYAAFKGYVIDEVFIDIFTGTVESREHLDRLKALLKTGAVEEVLIYDIGRLARDIVVSESLYLEFRRDAKVTSVTEKFEDGIEGDLLRHIKQAFFHYDRAKTLQKLTAGKIQSVTEDGRWPGGWGLLGYRSCGDGQLRVVTEEVTGKVIPLFELHAQRKTKGQIARELNASGVTTMTGRKWDTSSVANVLSNYKFYAGVESIWAGAKVKNEVQHEAVLPPELVERIETAWARPPGTITTSEAAAMAGTTVQTIHRWRKAGLLSVVVMKSLTDGEKLHGGRVNYYFFDPAQVAAMQPSRRVKHEDRPKPAPSEAIARAGIPRRQGAFRPPDQPAGTLTVQQAAERIGKSIHTVRRLVEFGDLCEVGRMRIGTTTGWLLDEAEVNALAAQDNYVQAAPEDDGALDVVNKMLAKNRWLPGGKEIIASTTT